MTSIAAVKTDRDALSLHGPGVVSRWTKTLIPTKKEAPSDAEAPSHVLLTRAGFIRRVGAGIYNYLPLANRSLRKISDIIREEMDAAGASELLMPALTPLELLDETGRVEAYGDLLFNFEDRHNRRVALGPTHEEVITDMMRGCVSSYKDLPLNLYQIQTKFRDEFRPRAGLLRGREFIMKDAYSFAMDLETLSEQYDAMYAAYVNIFTRLGFDFSVVEAEAGPIGGSASHEFMVNCETGEDTILVCPESGYAANVEKAETGSRAHDFAGEPTGELQTVHTPDTPTIESVTKLMKVKPANMLKTVVFENVDTELKFEKFGRDQIRQAKETGPTFEGVAKAEWEPDVRWVVAVVRADHDVNEGKVRDIAGCQIRIADPEQAKAAGVAIGYVSPRVVLNDSETLLLVDPDAAQGMDAAKGKPYFWATGADEKDHHVKHFNWVRELGDTLGDKNKVRVADIRNAAAGDPSPRVEGTALIEKRGIEVGHIFKLGTKYSEAMGFTIMDDQQERRPVIMGCYGIGVSRCLAACVEMSHDDDGIIWPFAIAPYHVLITPMDVGADDEAMVVSMKLAGELSERGFDVLVDDRNARAGSKFKDADLIGVPLRIIIGSKALAEGSVEFKLRRDGRAKAALVKIEDVAEKCLAAAKG